MNITHFNYRMCALRTCSRPAHGLLYVLLCGLLLFSSPQVFAQDGTEGDAAKAAPTQWQLQQQWEDSREVDEALQVLKQLRDDPASELSNEQNLTILHWQLRYRAAPDAETTFNLIPEFVVGTASQNQFPYSLTRKLGAAPDRYDFLQNFIARPTLKIDPAIRRTGNDRIFHWRSSQLLGNNQLDKAIEVANQISVATDDLLEVRHRDYRTSEYLLVNTWQAIFSWALANGKPELSLEVLQKFEHQPDRSSILEYSLERVQALPESETRTKLLANYANHDSAYQRSKKAKRMIAQQDLESAEALVSSFASEPSRYMSAAIKLIKAYQKKGQNQEVGRWLDRILAAQDEFISPDKSLLNLMIEHDRMEQAVQYFAALKYTKPRYGSIQRNSQPLIGLAVQMIKDKRELEASEVVAAIQEPAWKSMAYAGISQITDQTDQRDEWWQESMKFLEQVSEPKVHDSTLAHNIQLLNLEQHFADIPNLLARFNDEKISSTTLARWASSALQNDQLSTEMTRSIIDRIESIDPRHLEPVAEQLVEQKRFEDCVYAMMKLREDTDPAYFSYVNYEFQAFFEFGIDRLTNEQLAAIFDRQLPKHRGIIMARALKCAKGEQRKEVVKLVQERLTENTDADVRLHNQLAKYFIEQNDLDQLRSLLEMDWPDDQFLDDDPVVNEWAIGRADYPWLPPQLAEKIGGAAMLEFARSLKHPTRRKVAYITALGEVIEAEGVLATQEICQEVEDPAERATLLLSLIDGYLSKQRPKASK